MSDPTQPAGNGPVQRGVRPRAWAIFVDNGNARMWGTLQPHVQKLADAEGLTITPLYDQAALDAAVSEANRRQNEAWKLMAEKMVAAERERWQRDQQMWEDTRTQRDELLAHLAGKAPLPQWAEEWLRA